MTGVPVVRLIRPSNPPEVFFAFSLDACLLVSISSFHWAKSSLIATVFIDQLLHTSISNPVMFFGCRIHLFLYLRSLFLTADRLLLLCLCP